MVSLVKKVKTELLKYRTEPIMIMTAPTVDNIGGGDGLEKHNGPVMVKRLTMVEIL